MTGQCKHCNQIIKAPPRVGADPTGLLEVSEFGDAIYNHITMYHTETKRVYAGLGRIFEARMLAQLARSEHPLFVDHCKTLTQVLKDAMDKMDTAMTPEDQKYMPVPEMAPPGFTQVVTTEVRVGQSIDGAPPEPMVKLA